MKERPILFNTEMSEERGEYKVFGEADETMTHHRNISSNDNTLPWVL